MIQILVPVDLGRFSRAGIRFAIQWSKQQDAKLLFVHVLYAARLTRWSDEQYKTFATSLKEDRSRQLRELVEEVFTSMRVSHRAYECRVIEGLSPEPTLLDYCRQHKDIDYVCMGTHGAGGLQKLLGTHAGNMLTNSSIPVVVVPKGYRARPITRILYASDLCDHEAELKKVAALAKDLKAGLHILHLVGPDELEPNKKIFEKVLKQEFSYPVQLDLPIMDETKSTVTNLQQQIRGLKPSLVVLFTHQDRTLFQKIFFPSKAENLAFRTQVPLLVIKKRNRI
ncbi:universal stress protein [Flavitalea sp. BT771]|uniref:universal stress protein n=1 Tax=Flavitalea sp. BT771 TaxID=3063329 RepID=UPI0026E3889B|nr:universal stress protein [Flavitalea sp. BT771]MDO6429492.1 universal stress protein [Flavitalea sp. BT771]MDV6218380.1 universal stress protein [Flavitalea sp. BT771]